MNSRNDIVEENITIPSEIRYVRKISSKILKKLESRKVAESPLFDIRLCVEEIVRNAIQHGSLSDKRAEVKINYRIEDGLFTIEVEDSGKGFDPDKVPDPTHEENIMKSSGRGVYLVRHLMDKVEYNDLGNKVKLTKRI